LELAEKAIKGLKPSCPGCGARHREIFEFACVVDKNGLGAGLEFETIVKPVVEHWGRLAVLL